MNSNEVGSDTQMLAADRPGALFPDKNDWTVFFLFCAFGFVVLMSLPLATRNLHFVIDDWEFLQLPLYNDTLHSIIGAIGRKLRVSRELYMILEAKLLGINRHSMLFVSTALHWLCGTLFGACVLRALPHRIGFALAATALAFAFPPLLATLFLFAFDSARIPVALCLGSALFFQSWAFSKRPLALFFGGFLYFFAQTFYENTIFFGPVLPLVVLPILTNHPSWSDSNVSKIKSFVPLFLAIAVSGIVFLLFRYLFGFIDTSRTGTVSVPSTSMIWDTASNVATYLFEPLSASGADIFAWAAGLTFGVGTIFAIKLQPTRIAPTTKSIYFISVFGLVLALLGFLPYWLIGLVMEPYWTVEARILSSASYGLILLLSLPLYAFPNGKSGLVVSTIFCFFACVYLAFGFGLRLDWQDAADRHCGMWKSLLRNVPSVSDGTTFLFEDLRSRTNRSIVFGGSDSLQVLVRALYVTPGMDGRIFAYHLDESVHLTEAGLVTSRSQIFQGGPVPVDRLILIKRVGDNLELADGFKVKGTSPLPDTMEVRSNRSRIHKVEETSAAIEARLSRLSINCRD